VYLTARLTRYAGLRLTQRPQKLNIISLSHREICFFFPPFYPVVISGAKRKEKKKQTLCELCGSAVKD
jgi:hypothetical protein